MKRDWEGHIGGMLGGAAISALLGPRYVRGESSSGSWIADRPPLKMLAFPERQVSVRQEMTEQERKYLKSTKKNSKKDDSNRVDGEEGDGGKKGRKRSRKGGEVESAEERT
eukprot:1155277-Pelagomonas_calceolata.AAC.6